MKHQPLCIVIWTTLAIAFFNLFISLTASPWWRILSAFLTWVTVVFLAWMVGGMLKMIKEKQAEFVKKETEEKTRWDRLLTSFRFLEERLCLPVFPTQTAADLLSIHSTLLTEVRLLVEETSLLNEEIETLGANLKALTEEEGPILGRKMDDLVTLAERIKEEIATVETETSNAVQDLGKIAAESLSSFREKFKELFLLLRQNNTEGKTILEKIRETLTWWTKPREELGMAVQAATDLAEQARILAVNASIEALRSGETGHGFSLVAEEAERLSERMLRLAHQVASQIEATNELLYLVENRLQEGKASLLHMEEITTQFEEALTGLPSFPSFFLPRFENVILLIEEIEKEAKKEKEYFSYLLQRLGSLPGREVETTGEKIGHGVVKLLGRVEALLPLLKELQAAYEKVDKQMTELIAATRELGVTLSQMESDYWP